MNGTSLTLQHILIPFSSAGASCCRSVLLAIRLLVRRGWHGTCCRFQPSSVPKQPFIATLPAALEDSEEGSGLKDTGPLQPAATPDSANAAAASPPSATATAGATAAEPAVAAVLNAALDAVAAQPDHLVHQHPISSADDSAEQNTADEQNGAADSGMSAEEPPAEAAKPSHAMQTAAPACDETDAEAVSPGLPSASAAAAETEAVMVAEATQLECFEQLPLDLLQDSGEESAPAVAGLPSTSPSCTRLGSGGSGLSRFAAGQSLFSNSLASAREQPSQLSALSCARPAALETDSSAGTPLRATVTQADEAVPDEPASVAAAVSNTADSLEAAPAAGSSPALPASEDPAGETEGGMPAAAAIASEAASAEGQWIAAKADKDDAEPGLTASAAAQQTFDGAQQQLAHPAGAAAMAVTVAGLEQADRKQQREPAEQAGDGAPLEPPQPEFPQPEFPQPVIATPGANSKAAQPTSALDVCIAAEPVTEATAASAEPPQLVSAVQDADSDAAEVASEVTDTAAEEGVVATAPTAEPSQPVSAAPGFEVTAPADELNLCTAAVEATGATCASAEPPQPVSAMPEAGSDAKQETSEPEIRFPAEETAPAAPKPAGSEPLLQPASEPAITPAALAKEKSVSSLGSAKPSGSAQKAADPTAARPARPPSLASKLRKPTSSSSSNYSIGNGTKPTPPTAARLVASILMTHPTGAGRACLCCSCKCFQRHGRLCAVHTWQQHQGQRRTFPSRLLGPGRPGPAV